MDAEPPTGVTPPNPEPPIEAVAPSPPGIEDVVTTVPTGVLPLALVPHIANTGIAPAQIALLTDTEKQSAGELANILGVEAPKHLAPVIPLPSAEEAQLAGAATVQEAMPLIGNMLRAEKQAGGIKKPYPRTALKQQHIVAFMLCNPFANTTEICSFFGISPTTLGNITKSDTFKALVNQHRVTIDSGIGADLQAQLKDTMAAAIEVVQKAVVDKQDPDYALQVLDKTANRMGMGNKHNTNVQINNNIVTPEMIAAARASRRFS
jgi:hypothetical protein